MSSDPSLNDSIDWLVEHSMFTHGNTELASEHLRRLRERVRELEAQKRAAHQLREQAVNENARLREALAKAVIALEEIAGSLSDEGRLAESALKELEADHE